eukprot:gene4656-6543_t
MKSFKWSPVQIKCRRNPYHRCYHHDKENINSNQYHRLRLHSVSSDMDSVSSQKLQNNLNISSYFNLIVTIPLLTTVLPVLLDSITTTSTIPSTRQIEIISLLLMKRIILYSIAVVTLRLAAKRAVTEDVQLGKRLSSINQDLFDGLIQFEDYIEQDNNNLTNINNIMNDITHIQATDPVVSNKTSSLTPLYQTMNKINEPIQAIALPIIIIVSLLSSFLLLSFQVNNNYANNNVLDVMSSPSLASLLSSSIPILTIISNFMVCFLFFKTEFKYFVNVLNSNNSKKNFNNFDYVSILSFLFVFFSFFPPFIQLWPLQNIINSSIVITVCRAIQLSSLPSIVWSLAILTLYDIFFVLGSQKFTDGGESIMEAVAKAKMSINNNNINNMNNIKDNIIDVSKDYSTYRMPDTIIDSASGMMPQPQPLLSDLYNQMESCLTTITSNIQIFIHSSTWKPGLFEIIVNNRITDVLGLADIVFPCLLVTWALRYDQHHNKPLLTTHNDNIDNNNSSNNNKDISVTKEVIPPSSLKLFDVTVYGYMLGCLLCEVFQTGQGQPALLFITPSMIITLILQSIISSFSNKKPVFEELNNMWNYKSK